ncbi:MAG: cytochrome c3 family protein [Burkholderiales bacterium]
MVKYLYAAASILLFLAACSLSSGDEVSVRKLAAQAASAPQKAPPAKVTKSDGGGIPSEITFRSSVGEVIFKHEMHLKDRSINCVECHHQINAKKLNTPHPEYLKSSTVNCQVCHKESEKTVYSCSQCHDAKPRNIADETLSAKVVIHQQCRKCHDVGSGVQASKTCQVCHTGKKTF